MFYRTGPPNRISYIGNSNRKKESLLRSTKLHIQYLRSLEDSERVRKACVTYLQAWYCAFYPERRDLVSQLEGLALELGGRLRPPRLQRKYAWMEPLFGRKVAKSTQQLLSDVKISCLRRIDKAIHEFEVRRRVDGV